MASARTIEEVLASIEEQRLEDEDRRGVERPKPWFNLLRHPSGAAWRSTDRVLGGATGEAVDADGDPDDDRDDRDDADADADVEAEEDADANAGGGKRRRAGRRASVLSRTQFNLLRRSERTNKQLRRTLGSILEVQRALSIKRERERRLAANSAPAPPSSDDDGRRRPKRQSIEDGRGRLVGDWREKRGEGKAAPTPPPPLLLCEDPSVALSLSIGMKSTASSTAEKRTRRMRRDAANRSNNAGPGDGDDYDDDDDAGGGGGPGGGGGGGIGATDYYYADNEAARASEAANATASPRSPSSRAAASARLAKSGYAGGADASSSAARKPVAYGPEQAMTSLKYRFGPNYSVARRVLSEVRSLMGGGGGGGTFRPRRVLDFGSGVGSSGAAALDVFGVGRSGGRGGGGGGGGEDDVDDDDDLGIDWVHSIDASRCMRETTEKVLKSVLEGSPWEDEANDGRNGASYLEEEEMLMLAEYERSLFGDGGGKSSDRERRTLERRRRRMERWEQTWERRTDARTRLTFGESIVDTASAAASSSSAGGGRDDGDGVDDDSDRRRLPWQDQIDEQRRRTAEAKRRVQQQQQHQDRQQQRNKGSFDLILCSYTLSELPSVPASLAAAALLWEKLAPDGVLVFVEPGTPDGFGTLRSVRSMLLECCPPPEVGERRRRDRAAATAAAMVQPTTAKEADDDGNHVESDGQSSDDDTWPEECHVIAPCTHNGTCPMSRHQRDHVKRNSRFAKYESAEPKEEDDEGGAGEGGWMEGGGDDDEEGSFQDMVDQWDDMTEGEKDEIKTMLGGGESMTDDDAKGMLEYMDSMGSDDEEEEDEDDDDSGQDSSSVDDDDDVVGDDQDYYNIEEGANRTGPSSKKSSIMAKTDVFGSSFCSFVHNFPGGTTRKRGEKFTYLVVQKRVPHSVEDGHGRDAFDAAAAPSKDPESLYEIDIVEMLSKSVHHAQKLKKEQLQKRLRQRRHGADGGNDGREEETPDHSYHEVQSRDLLRMAVEVEDQFLDSTIDSLGLEMLHGDERRRGWGRLIRAPLKRRGHVLLDYCSAGCGGTGGCPKKGSTDDGDDSKTTDGNDLPDGTQGRITRQKVSRGWSARAAPGCYSAARKARWGGLWPDLSERVKRIEMEEERERLRNGQEILPGTMVHRGPKSRKMVSH